jgi:pimeloyl-ACP methyl ester carboxylesterase
MMLNPPLLPELDTTMINTPRLRTHTLMHGPANGEAVILVHGNASAARFFEELMVAMPAHYWVIAPDLRGYGRSEAKPVDATRGVRDFSDDLFALVQTLGIESPHLVGWSLGGNVVVQYAIDHPSHLVSITLIAAGSPYGFGGTCDNDGTPTSPDFAGSGGGTANPEFVKLLAAGERGGDNPLAPRNVMNNFYFKPPFRSPREEVFLGELLLTVCSTDNYPGNLVQVDSWPGVGPGTTGVNNALSPKYFNLSGFAQIEPRPPVLWVRGDTDRIVSDTSFFDFCYLGQLGLVPDWPGAETHPPQPMVSQLRALLDRYAANGGSYREVVLDNCGHSPHIEQPEAFNTAFFAFLKGS